LQIERRLTFAMPADYSRHTGGWIYGQRIVEELTELGWRVDCLTLPAGFPRPSENARAEAAQQIAALADGTMFLTDQLALGVLPELAERESERLRLVMIVHHPLALEDGSTPDELGRLLASERQALRHVVLAIVPSSATADALVRSYGVPPERMAHAAPGTDPMPISDGSDNGVLRLLSLGSIVPRKDHGTLIAALAPLAHLRWHLMIVGNPVLAPEHAAKVRKSIDALGLRDRVAMPGTLDAIALEPLWRNADVYVAASRHEGYGMAVAEAISRGIPVVTTAAGAVGDWIDRRAALVVPVGDADRLRSALLRVLTDGVLRRELRAGALLARTRLPSWRSGAEIIDRRLTALLTTAPARR
jgi:glycosyltransferase involved in cell wall biosynthesis